VSMWWSNTSSQARPITITSPCLLFTMDNETAKRKRDGENDIHQSVQVPAQPDEEESSDTIIDTSNKFLPDIPTIVLVDHIFPFVDRPTWNACLLANKEIYDAVTNHKFLVPPWPERCLFEYHLNDISQSHSPTFSPDGELLAYGTATGEIHIWNKRKGCVAQWIGHGDNNVISGSRGGGGDSNYRRRVDSLAFSPDGKLLLSSGKDGFVNIWDLDNGNRRLRRWPGTSNMIAFSPDGQLVAWKGRGDRFLNRAGQRVILMEVSDSPHRNSGAGTGVLGAMRQAFFAPQTNNFSIVALKFSPNEQTLALGGMRGGRANVFQYRSTTTGVIELWKLQGVERTCTVLEGRHGPVTDLTYSRDGRLLVCGCADRTIRVWDVTQRRCIQTLKVGTAATVAAGTNCPIPTCISISPNGKCIASGSENSTLRLWSVADGKCLSTIKVSARVLALDFSTDGQMLVVQEKEDIRLRSVFAFEDQKRNRENLMELRFWQLEEAFFQHNVYFTPGASKEDLVDLLVTTLNSYQTEAVYDRYSSSAAVLVVGPVVGNASPAIVRP
jgi:WD40 repeat protein